MILSFLDGFAHKVFELSNAFEHLNWIYYAPIKFTEIHQLIFEMDYVQYSLSQCGKCSRLEKWLAHVETGFLTEIFDKKNAKHRPRFKREWCNN
jgi:hypothetical protein